MEGNRHCHDLVFLPCSICLLHALHYLHTLEVILIYQLKETGSEIEGEGPFIHFFTGKKSYILVAAPPVYQNAEELLAAAKLALVALHEVILLLIEIEEYDPAKSDYEARAALIEAIKACK